MSITFRSECSGICCVDDATSERTRQAFDEVTRPFIRHLLDHAMTILRSEDLAWDAVQEALLKLWMKSQQGDSLLEYAGPWLCRAVVLRSLQIRRQNGRRIRHERCAATRQPELVHGRSMSSHGETAELKQLIDIAQGALPEEFRVVWELRNSEGLGYAETAKRLGIPVGTVRSRLSRARTLLQQVLKDATCDGPGVTPAKSRSISSPRLIAGTKRSKP